MSQEDPLADIFGKQFGEQYKPSSPTPQEQVEYEDLFTGPKVEKPFRGVIPPETQQAFVNWLYEEGMVRSYPFSPEQYLMRIDERSVTSNSRLKKQENIQVARKLMPKILYN